MSPNGLRPSDSRPRGLPVFLIGCLMACAESPRETDPSALGEAVLDEYLENYFETFPSRATAVGRHEADSQLEALDVADRESWLAFNYETLSRIDQLGDLSHLDRDVRLDLELIDRQARLEIFESDVARSPERDPLYWTSKLANATIFLLVREDLPAEVRLLSAAERASKIPRLAAQAEAALDPHVSEWSTEICRLAAGQSAQTAAFYRGGFRRAAEDDVELSAALAEAGDQAAAAIEDLTRFLEERCHEAQGSPRLGEHYAEKFALVTGESRSVAEVLAAAQRSLVAKRAETAEFARGLWPEVFPEVPMPTEDKELISGLFRRIGDDHAKSIEDYVDDFTSIIDQSVEFVRERNLLTLPEPLTLRTDRSPEYLVGASVGGVYPAGPYAPPDAETLLLVPTPPQSASDEQRIAFFRDFNHHFNVMIVPHEVIPGHYLQLKFASRHPRKVRALFGDAVYIEGWGTFCERLLLDSGWGTPMARLAHLKKQLENIARTIVDIRVHTEGMTRDQVLEFVQQEALQEQQFAANMWRRALTSSPQLTTYYLGYERVRGLYEDVQQARGDDFDQKSFLDGMMELGPVGVRHYRTWMLD